jgi:aminoglycoside 3-N-acetyltransferase
LTYSYSDLLTAYGNLGLSKGAVIYLTADLGRLMAPYSVPGKAALCQAHVDAIFEIIGPDGTLVVGTASTNLCNTSIVFDPATTPSNNMGVLSEYVRQLPGTVRSFHPTGSYCAYGAKARALMDNVSRHTHGPQSPEHRLLEYGARCIAIGKHPRHSCTAVHYIEHQVGVPYRYTKEFVHPVRRGGQVVEESFYRFVLYQDLDIAREENATIFAKIGDQLATAQVEVGRGMIRAYDLSDFHRLVVPLFLDDVYVWCGNPPSTRPFRQ